MSSPVISFPAADRQQWHEMVTKALKGATPDSLCRRDEDGLDIAALYQVALGSEQACDAVPVSRLPANPAERLAYGWRVCQPVDGDRASEAVNEIILEELNGEANGIYLTISAASATKLDRVLQKFVMGAADIVLDSGNDALDVLTAFQDFAHAHGQPLADMRLDLAIDPFAPDGNAAMLGGGLDIIRGSDPTKIPDGIFRLNGWQWHNQGMSQVQELAYILAGMTEIFRAGHTAGISAAHLASTLSATIALPADMFDGIAKCRALRRGWAGLVTALGLDAERYRLRLHAIPSMRMFSLADSDVNMLRTTTALLGGAIGGADMMTAFAHDALTGTSALGRRLARMQQIIMIEESGLGRSLDAAGGAAFIEARSDDLVTAAWARFQDIERAGGALGAHAQKQFDAHARDAATARHQRLLKGAMPLLGVTLQPDSAALLDALPRWQKIRRPAAVIEAVRQQTAKSPPRILILQQAEGPDPRVEKIRRLLRIGGMQAVHLVMASKPEDAIGAARPAAVIVLDVPADALDPAVRAQLDQSLVPGAIFEADAVLQSAVQIDWLVHLADITKDAG